LRNFEVLQDSERKGKLEFCGKEAGFFRKVFKNLTLKETKQTRAYSRILRLLHAKAEPMDE
jgi:hypothetical protein